MSFRDLLDHRVDIVRPVVPLLTPAPAAGSDEAIADEQPEWNLIATNVRCSFWPIQAPVSDYGAGETPQGRTAAWFEKTADVEPRDVLVTVAGPESGKRWRVVAKRSPGRRFGTAAHHIEVECDAWTGELPN